MRLIDRLTEYGSSDFYGFHMPGHKRQEELGITSFPNPFSVDITEIDGFDSLHHAEGILLQSMERAADIYGADRTYYLVNGSTCGILAALCAAVPEGGRLLMARNSHKSAYHAAFLNRMDVSYVYPEMISGYGIAGGISPECVEQALCEDREGRFRAVFLTSPTYEGIVSDVERIARAAHQRGIPLIVDEAHGAHFSFCRGERREEVENKGGGTERRLFPESALGCGADAVIQSLHKTLPSLTQTAVLHIKGGRLDRRRLELYLQMFQSSSPSYVFMASIENCIQYMDGRGRKRLEQLGRRLELWSREAKEWKCLRLLGDEILGGAAVFERDLSKLVVAVGRAGRDTGFNGTRLAEEVRARFHLEPEMCCDGYVIFMTSLMDSEEGFSRLREALGTIDRELWEKGRASQEKCEKKGAEQEPFKRGRGEKAPSGLKPEKAKAVMTMAEAFQRKGRRVSLERAAGLVSRGFLTVYPPGIPTAVPGERISGEMAGMLLESRRLGLTVEGIDEAGRADTADISDRSDMENRQG